MSSDYTKKIKREHLLVAWFSRIISVITTLATPSLPETVDGRRQITSQMEKNRGLTRAREKLTKNPRKKYRSKHEKAVLRRKGQVRNIRKPSGPYDVEATGTNAGISRSKGFQS